MSVPTVPSSRPSTAMDIVVTASSLVMTDTATSAITIIEAYSTGPKLCATTASGGENSAMIATPTQPAKNEASAAMQSAGPARPCLAIGWPSRQMTTEVGSPGMFIMIAVVEPA